MTPLPHPTPPAPHRRLAALRGPHAPRPLDSRALAALAANPGCARRALLDSAGVDKAAVAGALGAPSAFGQSQFAFARGHSFEARATADGGLELVRMLCAATEQPPPDPSAVLAPDTAAEGGPPARCARTREAFAEAAAHAAGGGWAVLLHPMLELVVAGAPVFLEPDAVVVAPGGVRTVVEIKSFPILDGSADPAKVGAAARQSAVYALALTAPPAAAADAPPDPAPVAEQALLVCPKDFSNLPTAAVVDLRKQTATVRRQLRRLTRVEEIAAALPEGLSFDPDQPADRLREAVAAVPAAYAPECLAGCDLAFHCRGQARAGGEPGLLGRGIRAELGGLTSMDAALTAAHGEGRGAAPGVDDPAVEALRRAVRLRAEALAAAGHPAPAPGGTGSGGSPCH